MTDKHTMPNEIWTTKESDKANDYKLWGVEVYNSTKYIRADSPDHYIVKNSDVDGDVMGALDALESLPNWYAGKHGETIRAALIAQSCSDKGDYTKEDVKRLYLLHATSSFDDNGHAFVRLNDADRKIVETILQEKLDIMK